MNATSNQTKTTIKWFHEDACKACSEGLNERMRELTSSGLSQRKAATVMANECNGELSADNIRKRYSYYNKPQQQKKMGKTSQPKTKGTKDHETKSNSPEGFT